MTRRTETSPYVALLAIAAAMLAVIALTGCGAASAPAASDAPGVSAAGAAIAWAGKDPGNISSAVLVDQETGAEYLVVKYMGINGGGVSVTPLLDADGTPRRMEE